VEAIKYKDDVITNRMTLNNLWEDYFKNYTNNFINCGKNFTSLIFGLSGTGKSTIMGTSMNSF